MKTTDSGIFLWQTYRTMQNMGLDVQNIFASVSLPNEVPNKNLRRDNATQHRFWSAAEKISGDSNIGLHVGENFPPIRGEIIEYLFLSSETFGDGLKRVLRYQAILTNALILDLKVDGNIAIISGFNHPVRHYMECALSLMLNLLSYITMQHFSPQEIWLPYQKGATPEEYQRVWHCPVHLGMDEGQIIFASNLLLLPSDSAEPHLLKIHEQIAEQQIKAIEKYDLIYEIEKVLQQGLLELGEITLLDVANRLNLHPRNLRADLQQIDTSFEKVLATYREKTAKQLLRNPAIKIDQIVYLLGFSESSAFSRAFKKWTGETPSNYRKRKQ